MADNIAELRKEAKTLGIKVDDRWGEARLQTEIDHALLNPPPPAPEDVKTTEGPTPRAYIDEEPKTGGKKMDVLLKADYWLSEGDRKMAGETVSVPVEEAKRLIIQGKAERADALPGE